MITLSLDHICFSVADMLNLGKKSVRRAPGSAVAAAADAAYNEGVSLLHLAANIEIYRKTGCGDNFITIETESGDKTLTIGSRAGLLIPAEEIAVAVATAGPDICAAIGKYVESGEGAAAFWLDRFGVMALSELSVYIRRHVEEYASSRGWGVSPSMQPGATADWSITGQRALYKLAGGNKLGLAINDASMLIPQISDTVLIGIGAHYSAKISRSLCVECEKYDECLWRRENETE